MIRKYGIIAQLERLRSSHSRLKTSPHSCANKCARLFKSMHQKDRFNGGGQSSTSFNGYLLFLLTRRCRCRRGRLRRRGRFTSQRGPFPKQLKRDGSSAAAGAQKRGVVCASARDDGYMYAGWIELCFRFLEDLFMLPTVISWADSSVLGDNYPQFRGKVYSDLGPKLDIVALLHENPPAAFDRSFVRFHEAATLAHKAGGWPGCTSARPRNPRFPPRPAPIWPGK